MRTQTLSAIATFMLSTVATASPVPANLDIRNFGTDLLPRVANDVVFERSQTNPDWKRGSAGTDTTSNPDWRRDTTNSDWKRSPHVEGTDNPDWKRSASGENAGDPDWKRSPHVEGTDNPDWKRSPHQKGTDNPDW